MNYSPKQKNLALPIRADHDALPLVAFSKGMQQIFATPGVPIENRLQLLLEKACLIFRFDTGVITRVSRKGAVEIVVSTLDCVTPGPVPTQMITSALTAQLISCRAPILLHEAGAAPGHDLQGISPARFMGMPILFDGAVYGTFELSSTRSAPPLDPMDQAAAYFVAAALAAPLALMSGY